MNGIAKCPGPWVWKKIGMAPQKYFPSQTLASEPIPLTRELKPGMKKFQALKKKPLR